MFSIKIVEVQNIMSQFDTMQCFVYRKIKNILYEYMNIHMKIKYTIVTKLHWQITFNTQH